MLYEIDIAIGAKTRKDIITALCDLMHEIKSHKTSNRIKERN